MNRELSPDPFSCAERTASSWSTTDKCVIIFKGDTFAQHKLTVRSTVMTCRTILPGVVGGVILLSSSVRHIGLGNQ